MAILELKNTKTEKFTLDQAEESMNSKAIHSKLSHQKYIKKNEQK